MNHKTFPVIGKYRFGWLLTIVLVFLIVYGLVIGLTESIWRLTPEWLFPIATAAIVMGWFLSGIKRHPKLIFTIGIITGFVLIIFLQSGMYADFFRALYETLKIQPLFRPPLLSLPEASPIYDHLYRAISSLNGYFSQISRWFRNLIFYQGGANLVAINLLWGSAVWGSTFILGWLLRRQTHAFLAALPALTLVGSVTVITRRDTTGLIVALGAVFALMILIEHLKRENRWENQTIDFSEEMRFDIISVMVPLVLIIITFASVIPQISLYEIRSLLNLDRRQEVDGRIDLSESLGLDITPLDPIISPTQPGLPRSHLIGSGPELSEQVIMEIDLGEIFLPPQVDPLTRVPAYYWFGRAYAVYEGSGWISSELRQETIPAHQEIHAEQPGLFRLVNHTIHKTAAAPATLYFSGLLHSVDQQITIAWHDTTEEFLTAQLRPSEYQVKAFVFDFSEEQLQSSDSIPPDFILENYLQLPLDLPKRVMDLALEITSQTSTPYEQAKSIETYLRGFEYTLDLPAPPEHQDVVDYFLFDLQKGYCDYFATAMVVIARAAGLPARFVVGYAPGIYDFNRQVYRVSEANAHSWPEVYLEPIGWIPFEPTASLSIFEWTPTTDPQPTVLPAYPLDERPQPFVSNWQTTLGMIILLLLFVSGLILMTLLSRKKKFPTTTAQIEAIYHKTWKHLTGLFFSLNIEHTPHEFDLVFSAYFQTKSAPGYTSKLTKSLSIHLANIIYLYETGVYSPRKLGAEQVVAANQSLVKLQIRSWLLRATLLFKQS
jgi:transglutaminase-like putative cysteine protease